MRIVVRSEASRGFRRMRLMRVAVTAVVAAGTIGFAGSAGAVRRGHDIVYLSTGVGVEPATSGYIAQESVNNTIIVPIIQRYQHGTQDGMVDYTTISTGSATAGTDYETVSDSAHLDPGISSAEVEISIFADDTEEATETFDFELSNARGAPGMILATPRRATITIVDDDGAARISFAAANYSLFEREGGIELVVIRQGDSSGAASVQLGTADGTATSPDDYAAQSVPVTFNAGQRVKRITVPIVNDSDDEDPESFTAALSNESGAALVSPSTVTIELLDDDSQSSDTTPPVSNFHIPRNGRTYGPHSPARDQLHISPSDDGSGVADIFVALRKKMRNCTCKWWRGTGFRKSSCGGIKWIDLPFRRTCNDPDRPFCIYQLRDDLKFTTRKTGIRSYTAWAYAEDNAGNIETDFDTRRNKATYFIKP
jgi:Calx-beta domain-containing protein